MPSRFVGRHTTLLMLTALGCDRQESRPVTGPQASAPVAAALSAFFQLQGTEWTGHLAINIPMDTPVAPEAFAALRSDSTTVTLFRDSSRYNARNISADSQRVLGTVYDVRVMSHVAWDSMVAADSNLFADVERQGAVYRVSREWCRGWPCHEGAWVDVRPEGRQYQGVVIAWWVE